MLYRYAKNLHNGNEVIIKETKEILKVIEITYMDDKKVVVMCENGNMYCHKDIK